MQCYLIAEPIADTSRLREALASLDVTVLDPRSPFTNNTSISSAAWIPEVDFLCAAFGSADGWSTPTSMLLEIGQAMGRGTPVIILAEPPRTLDPSLSPLPVLRPSLDNEFQLRTALKSFIESFSAPRAAGISIDVPMVPLTADTAFSFATTLNALREESRFSHVSQAVETLVGRLLTTAGAEIQATQRGEVGDFAIWVPGTEKLVSSPLVVDVRVLSGHSLDRGPLDRLQLFALQRGAAWSILVTFALDRQKTVRMPPLGLWPQVMVFDLEDLISRLQTMSLAQILIIERNVRVHGLARP